MNRVSLIIFVLLASGDAIAEKKKWKTSVANSFSGTDKQRESPATIEYRDVDGESFQAIDIAFLFERTSRNMGPIKDFSHSFTFEYHRNELSSEKRDDFSIASGLSGYFTAVEADRGQGSDLDLFMNFDIKGKRDRESSENTSTASFKVTPFKSLREPGKSSFNCFGRVMSKNDGSIRSDCFTSLGVSYINAGELTSKTEAGETEVLAPSFAESFLSASIDWNTRWRLGEFEKNSQYAKGYIVFGAKYRHWHMLSESQVIDGSNNQFSADLTWYMDPHGRFGFGVSYKDGNDPERSFLEEESASLGFRIKYPGVYYDDEQKK